MVEASLNLLPAFQKIRIFFKQRMNKIQAVDVRAPFRDSVILDCMVFSIS
jgi:hypothetical protein